MDEYIYSQYIKWKRRNQRTIQCNNTEFQYSRGIETLEWRRIYTQQSMLTFGERRGDGILSFPLFSNDTYKDNQTQKKV